MRKLRCYQISGVTVQDVLDEFNERAGEFGITDEADLVTVSAMPATHAIPTWSKTGPVKPKLEVVIVYWSER